MIDLQRLFAEVSCLRFSQESFTNWIGADLVKIFCSFLEYRGA